MSKGTILLFFILSTIASLLLGINIGKKISPNNITSSSISATPTVNITSTISPSITINSEITPATTESITKRVSTGTSTYTDESCGYTFSIPGSFIKSTSENGKSTIITDPNNPQAVIAAACAQTLPRPPLSAEKIEAYTIDGVAGLLYHDKTAKDGTPRDEVIVKHPDKNLEIIIAGYGPVFQQVLYSFKFIRK